MGFIHDGGRYSDKVEMGTCDGEQGSKQRGDKDGQSGWVERPHTRGSDTYIQLLCQRRKIQLWEGLNSSPRALKATVAGMMTQ